MGQTLPIRRGDVRACTARPHCLQQPRQAFIGSRRRRNVNPDSNLHRQTFSGEQTMTRIIRQVPWTIVLLVMAALCLFGAMRTQSLASQTVQAGTVR